MAKAPRKTKTVSFDELKSTLALQEKKDFIAPNSDPNYPEKKRFFQGDLDLRRRTALFDTETTGLDTQRDRVIEIAAEIVVWENGIPMIPSVLIHAEMGEIKDRESPRYRELAEELKQYEFHAYLSLPDGEKIPPETTKVHGITDEFLRKHGRDARTVMESFRDFVGDSILAAHNAAFDGPIMKSNCLGLGVPEIQNRIIDTLHMARQRFSGFGSWSLDYLAKQLGVSLHEREKSHAADVDSRILAQIYRIMLLGTGKKRNRFSVDPSMLSGSTTILDQEQFRATIPESDKKDHDSYLRKNSFRRF